MNHWLMKSEPDVYSIHDLKRDKTTLWEGVRNYMARNFMMKEMKKDDLVLFYHSNAKPSAIVGLATVATGPMADPTQFDSKSPYYDPRSRKDSPRWQCVKIKFKSLLPAPVTLEQIKADKSLSKMVLLNNSRLSVQPVTKSEYEYILRLSSSNPKEV